MNKRGGWLSHLLRSSRCRAALVAAVAAVLLLTVACGGGGGGNTAEPSPMSESVSVTLYRSPTCGCCAGHEAYLRDYGFQVKSVELDNVDTMKEQLKIPRDMWSCHTAVIDGYFIEGHVPVEAIQRLLKEKPAIDGIALPGMVAGSPGMSGEKEGPFVIYAIKDGVATEFMRI